LTPFTTALALYLLLCAVLSFVKAGYVVTRDDAAGFVAHLISGIIHLVFSIGLLLGW